MGFKLDISVVSSGSFINEIGSFEHGEDKGH